ncbi:MAG: hypothetical protein NVS9B9_30200 [Ktedonobacteraceae bacterium]
MLGQVPSNTHLLTNNIKDTLYDILPEQTIQRRATLVRVRSRRLGACLPIRNPLVDGVWDAMLCATCDFFVVGHILGMHMNEWVEVVAVETERASDGHGKLAY